MAGYAQQRAGKRQRRRKGGQPESPERAQLRAQEQELRCQRRRQRWARRALDEVWRAVRQERRRQREVWRALPGAPKRLQRAQHQAEEAAWREQRAARQRERETRRAEDVAWRQARQGLREQQAHLQQASPAVPGWLAILVIIDNCTRQCLGVPLFPAGAHVTAEMVAAALQLLLPAGVRFLISDNGPQFRAEAFAALARAANFLHVRIAPHRACTNGVAERLVGTLKDWLEGRTWTTAEEGLALLAEFPTFYNDRPHQGAELKGLSPDEYARRLTTCATW